MPNENAAVDFNVPPLANAVTGVVRLRNGEEVPVLTTGCRIAPRDGSNRNWARHGGVYGDVEGRHPEDIVAQVSVGPTGPGRYETVDGGSCDIIGRDEGGWYVVNRLLRRDDFGRCFNRSRSIRVATGDLRRRIGDLPEPIPVGSGHADYRCRNGQVRHLYGLSDLGVHLSHAVPDGDDDRKPHDYLPDGRERAGDREWDVVAVVPPEPSCPASEGAATVDAIWGGVMPPVDAKIREWLREMLREVASAIVHTTGKGFVLTASPERFALSEADMVPVSSDDLRVLWALAHDFICEQSGTSPPSEAEYRAISRAAAALGDVEVPDWMLEHARKEGWT